MTSTKNAPGERTIPAMDKFPDQLYRDVKSSASQKGISIKEFFIQALRYALDHDDVITGRPVVNLQNEDGQGTIRRGASQDVGKAPAENIHDKKRKASRREKT